MRKTICFLTITILTAFIFIFNAAGCSILGNIASRGLYDDNGQNNENEESRNNENIESETPENILPLAIIEVYQHNYSGDYFTIGNPVYFSAANSTDADGDVLNFQWQIGSVDILTGEEVSHIFDSTGEYEITLMVNDGSDTITVSKKIYLAEMDESIIITRAYEMTVGIKYIINNKGPGDIKDVMCLFEVPQTYQPFQFIKSRKSNYNKTDELYSNDYNLIARFNLGNISVGESVEAYINCDSVLYEYEYVGIEDKLYSYDSGDKDLSLYTRGEYYINSDSQQIKSAVKSVVGKEADPRKIAEKIYNFVVDKMVYDDEKLGEETSSYSYASDILQSGKGICTDYSILYAALCRAAGIPAKFVQGLPVFSILTEGGGKLPYAHAWVEIKLPGYGWVPIDITTEGGFMAYNYYLNMETYKGSGVFYKSLSIDGENYFPVGFYYLWEGDTEPNVTKEAIYSVSGLDPGDINLISENEFLKEVEYVLSEYNAAINHINLTHTESWIFNDPQEIAIEETFLTRLMEISQELKNISYSESYAVDRNNLVEISQKINLHKEEQIKCLKSSNYDCSMNQYNMFINSANELFEYYNNMVLRFNQKY